MSVHNDDRGGVPSASGLERAAHCPSSFNFEQFFREARTKAAEKLRLEGEFLHDVTMEFKPFEDATEKQQWIVKRAWKQRSDLINATIGKTNIAPYREKRIYLHDKLKLVMSARHDEMWQGMVMEDGSLIIDFKYGYLDVEPAQNNWQLRGQAVCFFQKKGLKRIFAGIVPPRCGDPTVTEFDEDFLNAALTQVIDVCKKAIETTHLGLLKAGKWCDYCRSRHVCPEAWSYVF